MATGVVNNMSADRIKKIDHEVRKIHIQIKETNKGLRNRLKDIMHDMETWDGLKDEQSSEKGFMPEGQEPRF